MDFYKQLLEDSPEYLLSFYSFGPDEFKECFSWMQGMCRSLKVEVHDYLVQITVLIRDENGVSLVNGDRYSKNFEDILMAWQKRAMNFNSQYFPVIIRKDESIIGKAFSTNINGPLEMKCIIRKKNEEQIKDRKLYDEMMERAKERLS